MSPSQTKDHFVFACFGCRNYWVAEPAPDRTTCVCPHCEKTYRRPDRLAPTRYPVVKHVATESSRELAVAKRGAILKREITNTAPQQFDITGLTISEMEQAISTRPPARTASVDPSEFDAYPRPADVPQLTFDGSVSATQTAGECDRDTIDAMAEVALRPEQFARRSDSILEAKGIDSQFVREAAAAAANAVATEEADEHPDELPASRTGIQLISPEQTPITPDVELSTVGPRMSEWLPKWTEQTIGDVVAIAQKIIREEAPGALFSGRVPFQTKHHLKTERGISALDGRYADALATAAVSAPRSNGGPIPPEKIHAGGDTLAGIGNPRTDVYTDLDSFLRGPVQTLKFKTQPSRTVLHLDAEQWLTVESRSTIDRTLTAIEAIAQTGQVYLTIQSFLLLEQLREQFGSFFEAHGIDIVETRNQFCANGVLSAPKESPGDRDDPLVAYEWLADVRDQTDAVKLVYELSQASEKTLTRDDIIGPGLLTESNFYGVKDRLADAGIVEWDKRTAPDDTSRLRLTSAGTLAAAYITPDARLKDPLHQDLTTRLFTPHSSPPSAVGSPDWNSGGEEAPSPAVVGPSSIPDDPDKWLAKLATAGMESASDPQYAHWLSAPPGSLTPYSIHRRYTAPATTPGIHLVDERIETWGQSDGQSGDARVVFASDLDIRGGEFAIIVQASLDPLLTLGRIMNGFLENRILSSLLRESELGTEFEHLFDGEWEHFKAVDGLDDLHGLLRDALQIGWKSSEQQTISEFTRRLRGIRTRFNETLGNCASLPPGHEDRRDLFNNLHGIIATMTALLHATGRHTVINVRVPQTKALLKDEVYQLDFLEFLEHTVPKQAVYQSPTGCHSWTRQTQDTRPEKLKWRRSPGINEAYPTAELTASWILTGPSITEFKPEIESAIDVSVRTRSDGKAAPPALEIPVRDATQPQVLAEVIEELAGEKNLDVANTAVAELDEYDFNPDALVIDEGRADDITRLLRVLLAALATEDRPFSASPHLVAEALLRITGRNTASDSPHATVHRGKYLRVSDLEYGLSQLPPNKLFPEVGPVATSFIQVLLESKEPLPPTEIIDRSISAATTRRTWESNRSTLLALGLVEERDAGKHNHYTATLEPWWTPASKSAVPLSAPTEFARAPEEHHLLFELSNALGLDLDPALFVWTDAPPDLDKIYNANATLRTWRPLIATAFADREDLLALPPPGTIASSVVIGREPGSSEAASQRQRQPHQQRQLSTASRSSRSSPNSS